MVVGAGWPQTLRVARSITMTSSCTWPLWSPSAFEFAGCGRLGALVPAGAQWDRGRDRDELRGAVYRADVDALVSLLAPGRDWPVDAWQLLGEAVIVVAGQRPRDIEPAARRCVDHLRDRDWEVMPNWRTRSRRRSAGLRGRCCVPCRWILRNLLACWRANLLQGGGRLALRTGDV